MKTTLISRLLLLLFALLLGLAMASAQTVSRLPDDWKAYRGNSFTQSVLLSPADSAATVTARLYYDPVNMNPVPNPQQPVVTKDGRVVNFTWSQTTLLPASGFIQIALNGVVRFQVIMKVNRDPAYIGTPGQLTVVSGGGSIAPIAELVKGDASPASATNKLKLGTSSTRFGQVDYLGNFSPFATLTDLNSTSITEGAKLFFTQQRARQAFSASGLVRLNQATGELTTAAIVGDVYIPTGSQEATLTSVNSTTGTFGAGNVVPRFTVDIKGRITGVSSNTITPGAIGSAGTHTLTTLRNSVFSNAPPQSILVRGTQGGVFDYDSTDTTTPDDNGLVIVNNGKRFKRFLPDRVITPPMFGAIPDDGADDWAAFQAMLQITGNYTYSIPSGVYSLSAALTRTNKAGMILLGAGSSRTILQLPNDSHGIRISNDDYSASVSYNGSIIIKGIQIQSTGNKSAGREALYIHSNHLTRSGPVLDDIVIRSTVSEAQNWSGAALSLHDLSAGSFSRIDVQLFGQASGSCLKMRQSTGLPMVENNFMHCNFRNGLIGIDISSEANLGGEGFHFDDVTILSSRTGVYAHSHAGSPNLVMNNCHSNSLGSYALYLDSYQQSFFTNCLFYANTNSVTGEVPDAVVRMDSAAFVQGNYMAFAGDGNIQTGTRFTGGGGTGVVKLAIQTSLKSGAANAVYATECYIGMKLAVSRVASGTGTGGTLIAGPGAGCIERELGIQQADLTTTKVVPEFDATTGAWKAILPTVQKARSFTVATASMTIDPSLYEHVYIVGATSMTLTVDVTKFTRPGMGLSFSRFDGGATAAVTVTSSTTSGNPIQREDNSQNATYTLGASAAGRALFNWTGAALELMYSSVTPTYATVATSGSYNDLSNKPTIPSAYSLPTATASTLGGVKLAGLQFFSTSSGSPTSTTVNLGLGSMIMANNTGAGTHTLVLDVSTVQEDMIYTITRYKTEVGPVNITLTNTSGNKIQDADKADQTTISLPTTTGQKQMKFWYHNPNFYFMGY